QDLGALYGGSLAEVRRGAQVLHGRRQLEDLLGVLNRELRLRLGGGCSKLLRGALQRGDVRDLVGAGHLDQRQVRAFEQAALDHVGVERRLQVLEREGVVDDSEVALAELREGIAPSGGSRRRRRAVPSATCREQRAGRPGPSAQGEKAAPRDRVSG